MKKSLVIISFAFIFLLSMSVVSAGFWDWLTGKGTTVVIDGCDKVGGPGCPKKAAASYTTDCPCGSFPGNVSCDEKCKKSIAPGGSDVTVRGAEAAVPPCGYSPYPPCIDTNIIAARGNSCSDVLRRGGDTCTKVYSKTFTSKTQITQVDLRVTRIPVTSGQAKGPSPSCIDDVGCTSGLKKCSGTGYQTCGNYDADKCLEWSSVTSCGIGKTCEEGVCVGSTLTASSPTSAGALKGCTDECSQGDKQCSGNGYITCGNFFSNPCKEFGGPVISCGPGETCSGGNCVACTDECSPQYSQGCVGSSSNRTCGNYDPDSCLEWSPTTPCVLNQSCASGKC